MFWRLDLKFRESSLRLLCFFLLHFLADVHCFHFLSLYSLGRAASSEHAFAYGLRLTRSTCIDKSFMGLSVPLIVGPSVPRGMGSSVSKIRVWDYLCPKSGILSHLKSTVVIFFFK